MCISVVDQHGATKDVHHSLLLINTEPLKMCISVVDQHRATKNVYQCC